jgi:hypothetical protein
MKQMIKDHPERLGEVLSQAREQLALREIDIDKYPEMARAFDLSFYTDWADSSEPTLRPPMPDRPAAAGNPSSDQR